MKADLKLTSIGKLVFPLLVLFLILLGRSAESYDLQKNLLAIWRVPILDGNSFEMEYYKCHKWGFEKESKFILIREKENVQKIRDSRKEMKRKIRTVYDLLNLFRTLETKISYNELTCFKILSFYKSNRTGLNGREKWKKEIVKNGKIVCGGVKTGHIDLAVTLRVGHHVCLWTKFVTGCEMGKKLSREGENTSRGGYLSNALLAQEKGLVGKVY